MPPSERQGGGFRAPPARLPLPSAGQPVSPPCPSPRSRAPRRRLALSPSPGPAPRTRLGTERFAPPPERGAAPRGGAGNSRGRSRGALAGSAAPPSSSPPPRPGRAAPPEWVGWGRRERRSRRRGARTPRLLLGSPGASRETRAPLLAGPRPLAVSASFAHTPPGPPGPQAFPALLLLLSSHSFRPGSCCRPPALLPAGRVCLRRCFLSHTHGARPRWLGRPLLSGPPPPPC